MTDQYIDSTECVRRLSAQIPNGEVVARGNDLPELIRRLSSDQETLDEYRKKELAVTRLHGDFCDGALATVMRSPTGELVPLTSLDWRGTKYWREIILSGRVYTRDGEDLLAPYNSWAILVPVRSFQECLDRHRPPPMAIEPATTLDLLTLTPGDPPTVESTDYTPLVATVVAALDAMEQERGVDPDEEFEDKVLLKKIEPRVKCQIRTLEKALAKRRLRQ